VEGGGLRLFFALPLPAELREALDRWQRAQPGIRGWSRPEGLHLTLAFLGDRPVEALPTLLGLAAAVADRHGALGLRAAGLGGFPKLDPVRVLWLGLDPCPALETLAADLRGALTAAGEAFDLRPFHPHLTLARFRRARAMTAFAPPPPAAFTADRLVLFESRPGGGYTPLGTWNLRRV
jgi:2'-5' RNA ligase